ncbi:hypothetical protein CcaverHIS002_0100400 [Cutaneotrichosporon cavernicola]|uniref:Protein kinase domain-containing protein n=1 Tax=Cutaneotrichosporon cavernicola TaxID=279322 RepID=A0AA48KWN0_9TREE|nr:uncharacterized protein CcaverHIS019_0100370 [Cutaneotrichosporon cavernicola]BEI79511.1 hypothetical protein CcaverHIS002_0100400 [Cutaneotrichosporon cavernicola]BEI87319.1 hypothetical protein CcaverHIS019_0100370 [Cutaneotrichosporon cavernicola]BEI95089.1 hypothetical protein CcaverHIS631_0100380 [Cutaneotrichosporon cavernicola]
MSPPSYLHRHLLLSALLDRQDPPPPDCFSVPGQSNEAGCKLDALLLRGWSVSARRTKPQDNDILHNVDSLRLKKNDFEVLGRIGEGQFGVVDAVRCKLNGQVYALKSIEKHMAARAGVNLGLPFERHVHMLAAEKPSPAPALFTSFQSPNALHLVTQYAPCGSIWDRLCELLPAPGLDTGRMEETEIRWWARQMVDAISWIHGMGYAHRDIKPHNFLLLPDGRLWLTDFGSAAPLSQGKVARRHCMLPVGTPDYIAPEVLRIAENAMVEAAQSVHSDSEEEGDRTVRQSDLTAPGYGPDVDWWSLGATLYEMAVGRAPFWAPTIGPTYDRIMRCDLRLPEDLPPQFKSLLSGLLCLNDVRLGTTDVGEIKRHSFFNGVDWTRKPGPPPKSVTLAPIDLGTLAESFVHEYDEITERTFDHFFNSSPGLTTMSNSMSMSMVVPESTWSRWVGWSWAPHAEYFGPEKPFITISPASRVSGPRQSSAPPATHMFTPIRSGLYDTPPTAPRSAPRSLPRTRDVAERQAFAQLLRCVEASAKKKLASTRHIPGSASTVSSITSPTLWRKQQPPTPTPMSRETTTLNATFTSKAGVPVPRQLSRTSSRTDLPSRPSSRASGHSRQGSGATRTSLDGSLPSSRSGSWRLRDSAFLAKLTAAAEADKPLFSLSIRENISRPGERHRSSSLSQLGENAGHQKPPSLATEPGTGAPREPLLSIQENRKPALKTPQPPPRPVQQPKYKYGVLGADPNKLPRAATAVDVYIPPCDPGRVGDGSRLAALEAWHKSLVNGVDNLERRLAEMTARYEK